MNPARAAALSLLLLTPLAASAQPNEDSIRSKARAAFGELDQEAARPMPGSAPSTQSVPAIGKAKELPAPNAPGPSAPAAEPAEPALANFVVDPNGLAAGLVVSRGAKGELKVFLGGDAPFLKESLQQRGALSAGWSYANCLRSSKLKNPALARQNLDLRILTTARDLYLTQFALREHADQLSAPEARAAVERYRDRAKHEAERINRDCASPDSPGPVIPLQAREQPRE
ncbi:MAG: hypothetical protein HY553_20360 [Elusimicrobia bacterium]|nr:hypothetical protein [Elusimicrobiota bacterium]